MAEEVGILVRLKERRKFEQDAKGVGNAVGKIGDRAQSTADRMSKAGKKASTFFTLPLAAAAGLAVKMAMEVDKGLREVNTLFGLTGEAAAQNFGELQGMVADLSADVGLAQTEITGGLYQAISAGVPKENAFDFMKVASQAAIGGVTDVETAVDGMTSIINAFGLDMSEAEAVADSMFTAVKGGKTNFEELSASIFQVAPAAAAAGVSMEETSAAIAAMTAQGIPTRVATTRIRAAMTGLQRPSEAMNAIFQDLGHKSAGAAIESEGLQFALDAVAKEADGDAGALQKLIGSVEAVGAVQALTGKGSAKFTEEIAAQGDKAGATALAYAEMELSASRAWERMKVQMQNFMIAVGNDLLPIVGKGVSIISKLAGVLDGMSPTTRRVTIGVLALVAALGPALIVTAKLITMTKTAITVLKLHRVASLASAVATRVWAAAQWLLNVAMRANPIGMIITALSLLAVGLVLAWKKSERFREVVGRAFEKVKEIVLGVIDDIRGAFMAMWDAIPGPIKRILGGGTTVGEANVAVIERAEAEGRAVGLHELAAPQARGGITRRAGLSLVGEQGPELLHLPAKAVVEPLPAGGLGDERPRIIQLVVSGRVLAEVLDREVSYAQARA